jgi:hypothetical protein
MKHTLFPKVVSNYQMPGFDLQASEPQRKRFKSSREDSACALLSLASLLSNNDPAEKGNMAIAGSYDYEAGSYDYEEYSKPKMRALSLKVVPSSNQSYKRPIGSKGSPSSNQTYKSFGMKASSRPLGNWMDACRPLPLPPRLVGSYRKYLRAPRSLAKPKDTK